MTDNSQLSPSVSLSSREEHRPCPLNVGVIGYGYWGPNVVRNLYALDKCQVAALCDKNPAALKKAQRRPTRACA